MFRVRGKGDKVERAVEGFKPCCKGEAIFFPHLLAVFCNSFTGHFLQFIGSLEWNRLRGM